MSSNLKATIVLVTALTCLAGYIISMIAAPDVWVVAVDFLVNRNMPIIVIPFLFGMPIPLITLIAAAAVDELLETSGR